MVPNMSHFLENGLLVFANQLKTKELQKQGFFISPQINVLISVI